MLAAFVFKSYTAVSASAFSPTILAFDGLIYEVLYLYRDSYWKVSQTLNLGREQSLLQPMMFQCLLSSGREHEDDDGQMIRNHYLPITDFKHND